MAESGRLSACTMLGCRVCCVRQMEQLLVSKLRRDEERNSEEPSIAVVYPQTVPDVLTVAASHFLNSTQHER